MQNEGNDNYNNVSNTEISDLLLKWLKSHGGSRDKDQQSLDFCKSNKIDWLRFGIVMDLLRDDDLIEIYGERDHHLRLKKDGWKAAEIGLENYLSEKENNKKNLKISVGDIVNTGGGNYQKATGGNSSNKIVEGKSDSKKWQIIIGIIILLTGAIIFGLIDYSNKKLDRQLKDQEQVQQKHN